MAGSKLEAEREEKIAADAHYDPRWVSKTLLRIDLRMLPLLGLLYAVGVVDRKNLGIARTTGMDEDLKLYLGERYSIASMIYFIPYIILQLPANIILRRLGARIWLTICVAGWGISQLCMGFVNTWGYLTLCRVFLGAFEAGFFPALVFIITTWYKRYEVQKRLTGFYMVSVAISGFSSLFAYAVTFLKGKGDLNGWQWIFIIEGTITTVLGIVTWLFIPDFPDKSTFLSPEEKEMVLTRVEADRGDSLPDKFTWRKIITYLQDWTLWSFALMFMCATMPAYAMGFFITIILKGMGYSTAMSLLLTAPPYISAAIISFCFAYISDRTKRRAPWLAIQNILVIIGLSITGYLKRSGVRYFGLFLSEAGASSLVPGVLAYSSNNITSHSKRAISTATIVAAGGVGGIFATTVYRQRDFPRYINGIWATIACQFLMLLLLAINTVAFQRRNRRTRMGNTINEETPGFFYTI